MNIYPLRCLSLFAIWLFFFAGRSQALVLDAGVSGNKPSVYSAAMVDGRPAVAWVNSPLTAVKYARALDADGNAWGEPVTLYTGAAGTPPAYNNPYVALQVVDGRPAVCFSRPGVAELTYVRAADASGVQWAAPVKIDLAEAGVYGLDMAVVDGKPALAYSPFGTQKLRYLRATEADGSAWGTPVTLADNVGTTFGRVYLLSAGGNPAVVSANYYALCILQAQDAAGTSWSRVPPPGWLTNYQPQAYGACGIPGGLAIASRMKEVISPQTYYLFSGASGTPAMLSVSFSACDLAMVGDKLGMAFVSDGLYLMMSDDSGGSQWKTPQKVLSLGVGSPSLLDVNGTPAFLYLNGDGLNYLHLLPDGHTPPEMRVEGTGAPSGNNVLPSGSTLDFGRIRIGDSQSKPLTVINVISGSVDLRVESVTIDGPDAADFAVTASPAGVSLPATSTVPFTLQFTPRSPGRKTAAVHVVSNSIVAPAYNLVLTGDSFSSEIEVHVTGGAPLDVSRPLFLPPIAAGTSRDYSITIGNPGAVELNGLSVTVDGTDSAEFSVVSPPAAAVAPGGSTAFTLRHVSAAAGPKTAMLHIASNVTGFEIPYNIPVQAAAGKVDLAFNWNGVTGQVLDMALRANGSLLVSTFAGLQSLRPDGRTDTSFFSPVIVGSVNCIAELYDGKILIAGDLISVNGESRRGLARLHPDGSLDESFTAANDIFPQHLTVQPDGKIVVVTRQTSGFTVRRLLSDGALDASFNVQGDNNVACLALREDGNIFIGGDFGAINGPPERLARIDAGGTAHVFGNIPLYISPGVFSRVNSLAMPPDGRVIAAGSFANGVVRFMPDGQPDPSPFPAFSLGYSLALQADGACLVGNGGEGISRVSPAGQMDITFRTASLPGLTTWADQMLIEADGSVLVAGGLSFEGIPKLGNPSQGIPNARLARLHNDPATSVLQVANGGTTLRWLRSGTAPEVTDVTFQSAGPPWATLGKAAHIPGGWELSGLTLPATGTFRALGRQGGSVIASVLSLPTPLESWRLQHFNTSSNTGDAADDADPDKDGLTNFTEYAFGLNPVDRASNALPAFAHNGAAFTATFTAPEGREDVLYAAERSATMLEGTWTGVSDTVQGNQHTFTIPAGTERVFVRFVMKLR